MKAALRPIDQHIFIRLVSRSTIIIMSYLHFLSVGVSLERMEAFGQCWQSCSITLPKETRTVQEGLVLARSHAYHLLIETDSTAETTTCNVQLSTLPLHAKNLQIIPWSSSIDCGFRLWNEGVRNVAQTQAAAPAMQQWIIYPAAHMLTCHGGCRSSPSLHDLRCCTLAPNHLPPHCHTHHLSRAR